MISPVIRRWLLPIRLVALIAAVWALPYRPDCDSLAWRDDPAIACADSQCIFPVPLRRLAPHHRNRHRKHGTGVALG